MSSLKNSLISGMDFQEGLLWMALPEKRLVATFNPTTGEERKILDCPHEVWDVCVRGDFLWMVTGGGSLGRQILLWSLKQEREMGNFNCPDGAGAGITHMEGRLWLTHPHNRKLFCLDPQNGKVNWVIRTENETSSPATYGNEFWLIESDPGPLGPWGQSSQGKFFFTRYDPTREMILDRLLVPFAPHCMTVDRGRFWYAEKGKEGVFSTKKDFSQL